MTQTITGTGGPYIYRSYFWCSTLSLPSNQAIVPRAGGSHWQVEHNEQWFNLKPMKTWNTEKKMLYMYWTQASHTLMCPIGVSCIGLYFTLTDLYPKHRLTLYHIAL